MKAIKITTLTLTLVRFNSGALKSGFSTNQMINNNLILRCQEPLEPKKKPAPFHPGKNAAYKPRSAYNMHDHPFHILWQSPYPMLTSLSVLSLIEGCLALLNGRPNCFHWSFGVSLAVIIALTWWNQVTDEGAFHGQHTAAVRSSLKAGFFLFLLSEIMFFFAFFWCYFHSSLNAAVPIGAMWPPAQLPPQDPYGLPLLNTFILLSSGVSATWSHHSLLAGSRKETVLGLQVTIGLAILFLGLQTYEYRNLEFSISDGVYGSTFFLSTGFHGFHVLIGIIFLIVALIRLESTTKTYGFTKYHHLGFETAILYWHFVDAVWIFLFLFIYWWGF